MQKRLAIIAMTFVSCGYVGNAPTSAPPQFPSIQDDEACRLFTWPLPTEQAVQLLSRTELFTDTGIYTSAEPTPQIAAFNTLLDQPTALTNFDLVAEVGTTAGTLYALCAFQLLDRTRYRHLVDQLVTDHSLVFTQFGCTGMEQPVSQLVAVIDQQSLGNHFRDARDSTFSYFSGPATICRAG